MAMFGMDVAKKRRLIQEVYRHPLIWRVTDDRYNNVAARWLAFEEIAQSLTDDKLFFSGDMIKIAWKNLMDYYNQIRRRRDRAVAAGIEPRDSKWYFYDMMHFIRRDKDSLKRKCNWMETFKTECEESPNTYKENAYSIMKCYEEDADSSYVSVEVENDPVISSTTKDRKRGHIQAARDALGRAIKSTFPDAKITARSQTSDCSEDEYDAVYKQSVLEEKPAFLNSQFNDKQHLDEKREEITEVSRKRKKVTYSPPLDMKPRKNRSIVPPVEIEKTTKSISDSMKNDVIKKPTVPKSTAEKMLSRLAAVQETSKVEYLRICDAIDSLLYEAEVLLGIAEF